MGLSGGKDNTVCKDRGTVTFHCTSSEYGGMGGNYNGIIELKYIIAAKEKGSIQLPDRRGEKEIYFNYIGGIERLSKSTMKIELPPNTTAIIETSDSFLDRLEDHYNLYRGYRRVSQR